MIKILIAFFLMLNIFLGVKPVFAIVDPLSVPNNKFGIHIISPTPEEASPAASLVNSSGGDWGYITVLVESKNRDENKWKTFFNDLRRRHLIPLVRLATQPEGDHWKRPYDGEEQAWADFLDNLNWPTKNRYVVVYNEPNHGREWGNTVDAGDYARTLDKTISALKKKSPDFFIINGGLDAATPNKLPAYLDEENFLRAMNDAVPGIFNRLDGWSSHSYPNPGFIGSPDDNGKGSIRTWVWELQKLRELGLQKTLPVFITETGWKHAEGMVLDKNLPSAEKVAEYYKKAFEQAWTSNQIVAVTPFLLNYQESPFDHFSFKKYTGEKQNQKILAAEYPDYLPPFYTLQQMIKSAGSPIQQDQSVLTSGGFYPSVIENQIFQTSLTFKNTGQSIWNERGQVRLNFNKEAAELGLKDVIIPQDQKIEPGQEYTFRFSYKAPRKGKYVITFNLFNTDKQFTSNAYTFTSEAKASVVLKVKSSLEWKKSSAGQYVLQIAGLINKTLENIIIGDGGVSSEIEAKYLLPDQAYDFTLKKPYYLPKTIHQTVTSGVNLLDFGKLEPDIASAILNPIHLWELLPFSNN